MNDSKKFSIKTESTHIQVSKKCTVFLPAMLHACPTCLRTKYQYLIKYMYMSYTQSPALLPFHKALGWFKTISRLWSKEHQNHIGKYPQIPVNTHIYTRKYAQVPKICQIFENAANIRNYALKPEITANIPKSGTRRPKIQFLKIGKCREKRGNFR